MNRLLRRLHSRRSIEACVSTPVFFALLLATTVALSSCEDKLSTIGADYYADTVTVKTVTIGGDSLKFAPVVFNPILKSTRARNINLFSSSLFMGRAVDAPSGEDVESWIVMQFGTVDVANADSAVFILKALNYRYGADTSSHLVDAELWGASALKINDSSVSPARTDLNTKLGTVSVTTKDSVGEVVRVVVDPSKLTNIGATGSTSFVLAPSGAMMNIREFGSSENFEQFQPKLHIYKHTGTKVDTVIATPSVDLHIVSDRSVTRPGTFSIRGGSGLRQKIQFSLAPFDSLRYATINRAELLLTLDESQTRVSTAKDSLIYLLSVRDTVSDSTFAIAATPTRRGTVLSFSLRSLVEYWLRNPDKQFGLELTGGYAARSFSGTPVGVEDQTINRWTFFGNTAAVDSRPKLVLTYSVLK